MGSKPKHLADLRPKRLRHPIAVQAGIVCGTARPDSLEQTLDRLNETDWKDAAVLLQVDADAGGEDSARRAGLVRRLFEQFLDGRADFLLALLGEDLRFSATLKARLLSWPCLGAPEFPVLSLAPPGVPEDGCDLERQAYWVRPTAGMDSRALLLTRSAAEFMLAHWGEASGPPEVRLPELTRRVATHVACHALPLVT